MWRGWSCLPEQVSQHPLCIFYFFQTIIYSSRIQWAQRCLSPGTGHFTQITTTHPDRVIWLPVSRGSRWKYHWLNCLVGNKPNKSIQLSYFRINEWCEVDVASAVKTCSVLFSPHKHFIPAGHSYKYGAPFKSGILHWEPSALAQ